MVEVVVLLVLEALDLGIGAQALLADEAVELDAHAAVQVGVPCLFVGVDAALRLVVQTQHIAIVRNTDTAGQLDDVGLGVRRPVLGRDIQLGLGRAGSQTTDDRCHGSADAAHAGGLRTFFLFLDEFFHDYPVLKSSEWKERYRLFPFFCRSH